jgi:hypothetical protein
MMVRPTGPAPSLTPGPQRIPGFVWSTSPTVGNPRREGTAGCAKRGRDHRVLDGDDLWHPERLARSARRPRRLSRSRLRVSRLSLVRHRNRSAAGQGLSAKSEVRRRAGVRSRKLRRRGHPVWVGNGDLIKFMSTEIVGIHTSAISVPARGARFAGTARVPGGASALRGHRPLASDLPRDYLGGVAGTAQLLPSYNVQLDGDTATAEPGEGLVHGEERHAGAAGRHARARGMARLPRSDLALLARTRLPLPHRWAVARGAVLQPTGLADREGPLRRPQGTQGIVVSSLPRPLLNAWWRVTGGGYSGRSKGATT